MIPNEKGFERSGKPMKIVNGMRITFSINRIVTTKNCTMMYFFHSTSETDQKNKEGMVMMSMAAMIGQDTCPAANKLLVASNCVPERLFNSFDTNSFPMPK